MRRLAFVLVVLSVLLSAGAVGGLGVTEDSPDTRVPGTDGPSVQVETVGNDSPESSQQPIETADTSAELQAALEDRKELSFTFSPGSEGEQSFSADEGETIDGVQLEFAGWENLDTGDSGTSTDWQGPGDSTYEVTYEASSPVGTAAGERTFDVAVDYDGGSADQAFDVTVLAPTLGGTTTQTDQIVLRGDRGVETSGSLALNVPNEGDGTLVPESVTFSDVPDFMTMEATPPEQISGNDVGQVLIDATVDHRVDAGTYQFDVTVTDNLGNEETYTLELTVRKPPVVYLRRSPVRIENATAGETTKMEITFDERSNFDSVEGVDIAVESNNDVASLSFEEVSTMTIEPGGTTSTNVSVTIDEDVERNRELEWKLLVSPNDEVGVQTEAAIRTEVLYQARFADTRLTNNTIVYNEPKDEIDVVEDNLTVELDNDGDFPLNVTGENVSIDGPQLSVANVDVNETIDARSTEEAIINVEGDPEAFEQVLTMRFELFGQTVRNESVRPARFNDSVEIRHDQELVVETETVDFGRQRVTGTATEEIRIAEGLGYQDIESFRLERLDGPQNDWLVFASDPPDTIPAGETVAIPVQLAFTVDAELLKTYEWAFLASGDEVESREVVVRGEAEPVNLDPVRTDLAEFQNSSGDSGEIAVEMLRIVDTVEEGVQNGTVPSSDIATALSAARSIVLLLSELDKAEAAAERDGPAAAQESVVRAATAYNTFVLFSQQFEDDRLVERAGRIDSLASGRIDTLVDQQEQRFQDQLDADPPLLEQAELNRQLSQLAALRGDTERAQQLEGDADSAFEAYADRIEAGEQSFQDARGARARIAEDHAIDAFGQPILVNPLRYSDFRADHRASLSAYAESESSFREAGAGERADTVAAERERVETELAVTRLSMFVSIGVYAVVLVLIALHVSVGIHAHRRDRQAVAPDDFFE